MTWQRGKPIEIFYSYASKDEKYLNELEKQLSGLKRRNLISNWYEGEISAGTDTAADIDKHISSAQLILLLVSPDFLASDYCYGSQMHHAMERHKTGEARVIPIILRPTNWEKTPF